MGRKSEFVIQFVGLQEGVHHFHYHVDDKFFELLDYSEFNQAKVDLELVFEKKVNMLVLTYNLKGVVTIMCDRCTDDFTLPVEGSFELIYKFGEGVSEDENIVILADNEIEVDITQPIYEFTALLLPSKRLHPEGMCNEEMLKMMDGYLMVENNQEEKNDQSTDEDDDIDPRWEGLKNLK